MGWWASWRGWRLTCKCIVSCASFVGEMCMDAGGWGHLQWCMAVRGCLEGGVCCSRVGRDGRCDWRAYIVGVRTAALDLLRRGTEDYRISKGRTIVADMKPRQQRRHGPRSRTHWRYVPSSFSSDCAVIVRYTVLISQTSPTPISTSCSTPMVSLPAARLP